jgi:hypothetical protein
MEKVDLANIGIIKSSASPELLKILGEEIAKIQSDFSKAVPKNKTLAGNILHEYELLDSCNALEQKAREMAMMHQEVYGKNYSASMGTHTTILDTANEGKIDLKLKSAWVNFQQKGEFNPMHNHTGMYSFVLWYKIPYYLKFEEAAGPGRKSNNNLAGKFQFSYSDVLGHISGAVIPVDKLWEGQILLFPSALMHTVYPFYASNEYRISVSGNLFVELKNASK